LICLHIYKKIFRNGDHGRVARWFVFQTKNPNLGKLWRVLLWKILVCLMTIWSILLPLGIFYGHLVYFVVIWYMCFSSFWYFGPRKIWQSWTTDPILRYNVGVVRIYITRAFRKTWDRCYDFFFRRKF
jgi:hypothetical protein